MSKIVISVSGGKLDGKTYEADLSQSSDHGFLVAEAVGGLVYDAMTAYPVVWEKPDPDTARLERGAKRGFNLWLVFQLLAQLNALFAQAASSQPGDAFESPRIATVTEFGRRFGVYVKAVVEAITGPSAKAEGNAEVDRPEK